MTQPVQEPTQGRVNQGLEFRTRQLFRRPSPPAGTAGSVRNTVMTYALKGPDWLHFDEAGLYNNHYSSNFAFDPAVPGGSYLSNEPGGTTGDYFIMGAPLGPQGARYSIDVVYDKSPTGGRLFFEWQTALVDPTITAVEYPNLIAKPVVAGTWYKDRNVTYHIDMYGAVPEIAWVTGVVVIYIGGADATMLSADGSAPGGGAPITTVFNGTVREMNGGGDGSVMWYLRSIVDSTVNSGNTSGDKDCRVYSMRITRLNEGGGESA